MKTAQEIKQGLNNSSGTEQYHHFSPLFPNVLLTDGVNWLAENCEAYWLMDCIGSHQPEALKDPMLRDFQLWTLKVTGKSAVLTCERDTDDVAITQKIEYTDFPLPEIKLYCNPADEKTQIILLTSEY